MRNAQTPAWIEEVTAPGHAKAIAVDQWAATAADDGTASDADDGTASDADDGTASDDGLADQYVVTHDAVAKCGV